MSFKEFSQYKYIHMLWPYFVGFILAYVYILIYHGDVPFVWGPIASFSYLNIFEFVFLMSVNLFLIFSYSLKPSWVTALTTILGFYFWTIEGYFFASMSV